MEKKLLSTRKYKAGYEIRREELTYGDGEPAVIVKSAYTPEGYYIGNSTWAYRLIVKRGIKPEPVEHSIPTDICCIGFCEREQKWYGWSHRAICGFGIGDVVRDENHLCSQSGWIDEYLEEHPEANRSLPVGFTAETLEDARRMAIAFADSVS